MLKKIIKVLVVDDSAIVRKLLTRILTSSPEIEVVGTASDPFVAREKLISLNPDVMTLDIEMPRMDGITFLQKVMGHRPIPTILISSLSEQGSPLYLKALEYGAFAVVTKPSMDVSQGLGKIGDEIVSLVKAASRANVSAVVSRPSNTAHVKVPTLDRTTDQVLMIASSTGGTAALNNLMPRLPANIPGTIIVQHFPAVFSAAFAARLNEACPFEVKEAKDGDRLIGGVAYVVPGNFHAYIRRSGAQYFVALNQEPMLHGVRPAADILFDSVAKYIGKNAIGVILTGMGKDGAAGLKMMRDAGSYNIAQDEKSCVVFGMPKEAIALDAIDKIAPLDDIPAIIVNQIRKRTI